MTYAFDRAVRRRSLTCAAILVVLQWSLTLDPVRAAGQATSGGQEHHHHKGPEGVPAQAGSRVMEVQPQIGDVSLVDSNGRAVSLNEAVTADVPVLVNFMFTSCTTICPIMSAGFGRLHALLSSERLAVRLVSISVDPDIDTPSRLREYATRAGAGTDWWFLTGTQAASEAAQRAFGAYRGGKDNHTPTTYVRREGDAPWERLDGLASAKALLRVYHGVSDNGQP
jgi:protein SCO1/2